MINMLSDHDHRTCRGMQDMSDEWGMRIRGEPSIIVKGLSGRDCYYINTNDNMTPKGLLDKYCRVPGRRGVQ